MRRISLQICKSNPFTYPLQDLICNHLSINSADRTTLSYDVDEEGAKFEPSDRNDYLPEPIQAPGPTENGAYISDTKQDPKAQNQTDTVVKDEPIYGNGEHIDAGPSWNGGHGGGGQPLQYNDTAIEQEPPPIGIKEDG